MSYNAALKNTAISSQRVYTELIGEHAPNIEATVQIAVVCARSGGHCTGSTSERLILKSKCAYVEILSHSKESNPEQPLPDPCQYRYLDVSLVPSIHERLDESGYTNISEKLKFFKNHFAKSHPLQNVFLTERSFCNRNGLLS